MILKYFYMIRTLPLDYNDPALSESRFTFFKKKCKIFIKHNNKDDTRGKSAFSRNSKNTKIKNKFTTTNLCQETHQFDILDIHCIPFN